ncbi:MAG: non-canonical purine NTP pyrophosphatase, partial [Anaerolineales bacterium]
HPRPWRARFRCGLVLAGPEGSVDEAEGEVAGEVVPVERGQNGFGYDPIFLVDGTEKTMAELDEPEKNRISHRARAAQGLMPTLKLRLGLS